MNVLVTGGAGYIGRFCVRRLLAAGHTPVVLDRRMAGQVRGTGVTSVLGDIGDRSLVDRVIKRLRIEAVVHLAAEKSVARSRW